MDTVLRTFGKKPLCVENNAFRFLGLKPSMALSIRDLDRAYEDFYCSLHKEEPLEKEKLLDCLNESYGILKTSKKRAQHLLVLYDLWPPLYPEGEDFMDFLLDIHGGKASQALESYEKKFDQALENGQRENLGEIYWIMAGFWSHEKF